MEFQGKKSNGICEMIEFKGDTNDTPNTILGNWQHDVAIYFNSENVSKFGEEIIISILDVEQLAVYICLKLWVKI